MVDRCSINDRYMLDGFSMSVRLISNRCAISIGSMFYRFSMGVRRLSDGFPMGFRSTFDKSIDHFSIAARQDLRDY